MKDIKKEGIEMLTQLDLKMIFICEFFSVKVYGKKAIYPRTPFNKEVIVLTDIRFEKDGETVAELTDLGKNKSVWIKDNFYEVMECLCYYIRYKDCSRGTIEDLMEKLTRNKLSGFCYMTRQEMIKKFGYEAFI